MEENISLDKSTPITLDITQKVSEDLSLPQTDTNTSGNSNDASESCNDDGESISYVGGAVVTYKDTKSIQTDIPEPLTELSPQISPRVSTSHSSEAPNGISDDISQIASNRDSKICNVEYLFEYDTIVLSGGAAKSIVMMGALQYLNDKFLLNKIENYIGTSAGAMIAYLLAIGYTPVEIIVYVCTHQLLEKLQDFNIVSMIHGRGAASYSAIQEQLERMTIEKIGYLPTLFDIKDRLGKNLICVTHNLTKNKPEYLSYMNYPKLPCLTAIRMSSNLPLVFEKYRYGNSFYTDGGISDNFAIDLGDRIGKKVLGIRITTETDNFNSDTEMNTLEFIYKLIFVPIQQSIQHKIDNASSKCDIYDINYDNIKFFNFNISNKEKLEMFSSGYNQMKNLKE